MKKTIAYIIIILLSTMMLNGQTEQMIIPGDLKQQTIITEPMTLRKGFLRAGLEGAFIIVDKVFDEEGKKDYILGSNGWGKYNGVQLALHYGITDRLEIGCKIPYINSQYFVSTLLTNVIDRSDTLISYRSKGRGLGDIEAGIKYQLLVEKEGRPGLTVGTVVTFPSGQKNPTNVVNELQYDIPTGEGYFAWESYLKMRKTFYPYSVHARVHYTHNFQGTKIPNPGEPEIEFRDGDSFILAANFSVHLNDWIALTNELGYTIEGKNIYHYDPVEESTGKSSFNYIPSLYFQIRRFRFTQGIIVPFAGKQYPADPVYAFGLSYIF